MIRKLQAGDKLKFQYKGRVVETVIENQDPCFKSKKGRLIFDFLIQQTEHYLYETNRGHSSKPIRCTNQDTFMHELDKSKCYPHPAIVEKQKQENKAITEIKPIIFEK